MRQQLDAFDPLTVRVEELIGEGDRVVARVTQRGVHTGTHPRMPEPTGRSFENEAIWVLTLTEGRISEIRAVSDRLGFFLQLGWEWPQVD
ncbi:MULTISPECIES: ester cyclase [unclassified Streptomyces]|uniref:ester cyclase n=1 Tax=unclassified Streptomyces TaxID=2593676 RepID=UPI003D928A93